MDSFMCGSDTIIFGKDDRFGLSRLDHRLFPGLRTSEVESRVCPHQFCNFYFNSESQEHPSGKAMGLLRPTNEWFFAVTKNTSCGQYS